MDLYPIHDSSMHPLSIHCQRNRRIKQFSHFIQWDIHKTGEHYPPHGSCHVHEAALWTKDISHHDEAEPHELDHQSTWSNETNHGSSCPRSSRQGSIHRKECPFYPQKSHLIHTHTETETQHHRWTKTNSHTHHSNNDNAYKGPILGGNAGCFEKFEEYHPSLGAVPTAHGPCVRTTMHRSERNRFENTAKSVRFSDQNDLIYDSGAQSSACPLHHRRSSESRPHDVDGILISTTSKQARTHNWAWGLPLSDGFHAGRMC